MEIKENWIDIKGFENFYQISDLGNVKSLSRKIENGNSGFLSKEVILKPANAGNGYRAICLRNNTEYKNSIKKHYIHRLVASHFLKNPLNKKTVNHINAIKDDNRLVNLEWSTQKENNKHAIKSGLRRTKTGSNAISKLTDVQVLEIREIKHLNLQEIAKIYSVAKMTIWRIKNKVTWKHI